MIRKISVEETRDLWLNWSIVFLVSSAIYGVIYFITFNRELSRKFKPDIKVSDACSALLVHRTNTDGDRDTYGQTNGYVNGQANGHTNGQASGQRNGQGDAYTTKRSETKSESIYTPENCSKYASCILSTINSIICAIGAPFAIFYHQYWEDPLYGTPGIAFYVLALFISYLVVDSIAMFVVYFKYRMKNLFWDILVHHLCFMAVAMWMELPIPQYGWICQSCGMAMEASTVFLNGQFLAKWYKCSESVIFKLKCGFLAAWFLVRVPISFGLAPAFWIILGRKVFEEYPVDKIIGTLVMTLANTGMQSLWTVLIIRKTYRTFVKKGDDADVKDADNFDLSAGAAPAGGQEEDDEKS